MTANYYMHLHCEHEIFKSNKSVPYVPSGAIPLDEEDGAQASATYLLKFHDAYENIRFDPSVHGVHHVRYFFNVSINGGATQPTMWYLGAQKDLRYP